MELGKERPVLGYWSPSDANFDLGKLKLPSNIATDTANETPQHTSFGSTPAQLLGLTKDISRLQESSAYQDGKI